jgi:hypothetical protein
MIGEPSEHLKGAPAGVSVDAILPHEPVELELYNVVILANLRPVAQASHGRVPVLKRWLWERMNRSSLQALALRSEVAWAKLWLRRLAGYRGYVIKSERDIHPCVSRDARCFEFDPPRRTPCGATRSVGKVFEKLYNFCDAVQFLSPLHRSVINAMVKIDVPQYEIAPPLDLGLFRNYTPVEQRKQAAVLMGDAIRVASTAERRAREAGYAVERIEYLSVPHEQMPGLLNQYRAVVVDPVMLHAFGRLAAEALACGCRVLASNRVGALSWPDPLAACRESNLHFWEMVMNIPAQPNPRRFRRRRIFASRADFPARETKPQLAEPLR